MSSVQKNIMASQERFGYEWEHYPSIDPRQEMQFSRWVAPLGPDDFRDKSVLDAGCGMGRNAFWALRWGARKMVAFDCDERSLAAARKNIPLAEVYFRDIYDITWENEFDIVISIGVVPFLENPKRALRNLTRALRPGGTLLIWVYSREGNGWFLWWLNPLRTYVTSRMPLGFVHAFAFVCSILVWAFVKLFRTSSLYARQLSEFTLPHIRSIVFDQLIPKIANYWTREETLALFENLGLSHIHIRRPETGQGWTVIGIK